MSFDRTIVPEQMDAPDLDAKRHRQALAGLTRINTVSRTAQQIAQTIASNLVPRPSASSALRLLDLASGGGDVPITVTKLLRARGFEIDLTLFDRSETALRRATEKAATENVKLQTILGNAVTDLPRGTYDVVTCSLFLHHLSADDAVRVLANLRESTAGLLVVSDLRRSRGGLLAAVIGCHLLSRSPIVHFDGPASVRAAFTREELHELARRAGLHNARIELRWPWRMQLVWKRPRPD